MVATFQSSVRINQTTGVVGEIILSGPSRARPAILNSTSAANNVVGRAFRFVNTTSDSDVTADADLATTFAGILVNPKVYATSGPTTGTLDPTLTLPNETEAELLTMGIIIVDLSQDAPANSSRNIGADIYYERATGILVGASGSPGAAYTQVPNAKISRNNVDGDPGLAIITLTN